MEYYSLPKSPLLWVDENGLTDRAKSVMEEIGKADEYGLRPSDYALPKASGFNTDDSAAVMARRCRDQDQLAVLGYAATHAGAASIRHADRKSRSDACASGSLGGDRVDRNSLGPGGVFAELPA